MSSGHPDAGAPGEAAAPPEEIVAALAAAAVVALGMGMQAPVVTALAAAGPAERSTWALAGRLAAAAARRSVQRRP